MKGKDNMIKVKICGIKTREAAIAADENGADLIGFVFYKQSQRFIHPFKAAEIGKTVSCKKVGVFVNESVQFINDIVSLVRLDYVQLHGDEDAQFASKVRAPIIKAWRYTEELDMHEVNKFPCDVILLDSFVKGRPGGTGQSFDWHKASVETRRLTKPFLVAGGISKENLREVIQIFRPYGVDLSGSLEINGVKSTNKIHEFMQTVKQLQATPSIAAMT